MCNFNKYIIKRWLFMRMASQEFYFKSPFEIKEGYAILKSIVFFALLPFELLFIFAYARIYGSLSHYVWHIILLLSILNILISNLIINNIKNDDSIKDTISQYGKLDYEERKKLYSFKNITGIIALTGLVPWCFFFIGILTICQIFPR